MRLLLSIQTPRTSLLSIGKDVLWRHSSFRSGLLDPILPDRLDPQRLASRCSLVCSTGLVPCLYRTGTACPALPNDQDLSS